jgi:hypothetical protein
MGTMYQDVQIYDSLALEVGVSYWNGTLNAPAYAYAIHFLAKF